MVLAAWQTALPAGVWLPGKLQWIVAPWTAAERRGLAWYQRRQKSVMSAMPNAAEVTASRDA